MTGVSGAKSVSLTAQIGNAFGENLFKNLTYFIKYVRDIVIIGLSKVGGLIGVDRVDTVDTEYTNNSTERSLSAVGKSGYPVAPVLSTELISENPVGPVLSYFPVLS